MPSVIVYPRRYTRVIDQGTGLVRSNGDPDVNKLFDDLMQHREPVHSWEFRRRALLVAMNMFNEFYRWAMEQQNNADISGYNYDFLLDTLGYINTGKRGALTTVNWLSLVDEEKQVSRSTHAFRAVPLPLGNFSNNAEEVVARWCSHPNGIEDMVVSLYVLFGRPTPNA